MSCGSAGCALKIISGSQDGLSQHWRLGAAPEGPRAAQHAAQPLADVARHYIADHLGDQIAGGIPRVTLLLPRGQDVLSRVARTWSSPAPSGRIWPRGRGER